MLKEKTQELLEAVISEIGQDDAAAMFGFLSNLIKSSPGKLKKISNEFKDPKNLKEFQTIMTTKNPAVKMAKGVKMVSKIFG